MEYLYDPHTHTAQVSKCGRLDAAELVRLYHARGYAGIAVTDHMHEDYISSLDCRDDWQACVNKYMQGYRLAVQTAKIYGMDIILGAELRFPENERDFLIYGIDEDFLRRNPYLYRMGHKAFYERFNNELLIIHAHPFRDFDQKQGEIKSNWVHGLETLNCNQRHESHNELAEELCRRNPRLLRLCGSDTHRPGDEARAAIVFNCRVRDSFEYKSAVESGKYQLRGCLEA